MTRLPRGGHSHCKVVGCLPIILFYILITDMDTDKDCRHPVPMEHCDKCAKKVEPSRQGNRLLGKVNLLYISSNMWKNNIARKETLTTQHLI